MKFKLLTGLPGTGPVPITFTNSRNPFYSEGLVVEFYPNKSDTWVANFEPGFTTFNDVYELPDGVLVIAGGEAYIVDVHKRTIIESFGGQIKFGEEVHELESYVSVDPFKIEMRGNYCWCSRRLSYDGIRKVKISSHFLTGEAWDPMGDQWVPFRVNLMNGEVEGGSYFE